MPPIIEIDQFSDPRLDAFANLRSDTPSRGTSESFVVEGRLCVERLVQSPHAVNSVLVERGKASDVVTWFSDATPVYSLPSEQISRLVGFDFHRGVLACGRRPKFKAIEELMFAEDGPPISLAILGVTEKENLGSMMRSAAALGIRQLCIGPNTADPFARRSIRVSMATALEQNFFALDRPAEQLAKLQRAHNIRTVATTPHAGATAVKHFVRDGRKIILMIGNEAEGLDPELLHVATDRVTIPMHHGIDSLNAAVAAAIFMHELGD